MNNGKTIREALRKAKKQVEKPNAYKYDVIYGDLGQYAAPGEVTRIQGDAYGTPITMAGVPYPLYGEDDLGYGQMMYPGMDYTFPGQYVTEIPMAQDGIEINDPYFSKGYWKDPNTRSKNLVQTQVKKPENLIIQAPYVSEIPITKIPTHLKKNKQQFKEIPLSNNIEDDDSWLENIAEVFDPTGLSSWDDVYRAYQNTGLSGETALELLGAIPLLGKIGKSGKIITGGFGLLQDAVKASKYLPASKQQKFIDKAFDMYQKYNKAGGKEVDEALGSTTKLLRDKIPYLNPTKWSSSDKAINIVNKSFKAGRLSDLIQMGLGSKDNSGFTWDMRHGDVPKFGGRNIFPQIELSEHGNYAYGGIPMAQKGLSKTPEEWEKEIRAVEHKIGDPKKWSQENYQELQDKLNEYKAWRENTPEGRAVIDYHNEPNEYVVFPPAHLNKEKYNMKRALELGYQPDEGGHWPSIDYESGEYLKSKKHPTAWMEYLYGYTLNPEQALNYNVRVNPEGYFGEDQLQYVPKQAYGGDPSLSNITGHYKTGGWLDEIEDEFRRGGGYATPPKLRRKAKKYGTSKNIQSSINKIFTKNKLFTRNYDVFGPSGKNIYNPNSKYEEGGGWLDEYQAGGSIVDYLSKKGIDSSKENRKKLAQQYGVKDYNFSAEKNIELLNKLVAGKPVAQKNAAPKPIPSYLQPIKPIEKPNAKSDRTGQKKNVKLVSDADLYSEDAKWYNSLPKEEKEFIKRSTAAQYKEPDELKQYVPQGKISKAWDVITNPVTALEEYHKHGRIPDNLSESPDRNAIDMAVDIINPAFYINAAGRTAKNLTSADTYSDIAKGLGAGALGLMGEEAPDEWVEGGLNTLDRALDAATAAQGLKLVKTIPRGYRDMKYKNELTVGKGANKQTFRNSADFLEAHKAKMKAAGKEIPLKKKEIAFLNKEIKQRGVLEASRRHPLDPRSAMAKAMVIPEDYNWKTVLNPKNIARNLYKTATEGSPESLYQMGHGRVAGWNTYLGIPTKNNPYRIHPESFKQGEDLLYTLPEKQIEKVQRMNVKSGSPFASHQMSPKKSIKELEFFKNIPAKKTKAFNQKAYDKVASDMRKVLDEDGNRYYSNAEIKQTLGPKSKFKYNLEKHRELSEDAVPSFMSQEGNMYRTGDWDKYIGSHGGVGWKVIPDEATGKQRWIMEDVWDIQPLSRIKSKAVPQFVKDLDFGKVLGGKNYKVRLDYLKNLNSNRITPLVPKKMGGWLDNMD